MKQINIKIHGTVQGVSFRWYIQRAATSLGLIGWVRNNHDGTVSVCAEGKEEEKLREFLDLCKHGPWGAEVEQVEEEWKEIGRTAYSEFRIEY